MTVIVTCPKCQEDLRPYMSKNFAGEKNPKWKGEKAKYSAIHMWVYRNFGKADKCEKCLKEKKRLDGHNGIQWANLSWQYKRDRSDWVKLCASCHTAERKNHGQSKYSKERKDLASRAI